MPKKSILYINFYFIISIYCLDMWLACATTNPENLGSNPGDSTSFFFFFFE